MVKKLPYIRLPSATDRQLDQLLEQWSELVVTDLEQMEASIPDIIVFTEDLGYRWWSQLFDRFSPNGAGFYSVWTVHEEAV